MEKLYRVKMKNGKFKDSTNENEANAYEVELRQQEIEEFEKQYDAEIKRKAKEKTLREINNDLLKISAKIREYNNEAGGTLIVQFDTVRKNYTAIDLIDEVGYRWAKLFTVK